MKELPKKYFDNDILIDLIFPLQQQQAPPINSISTAAVTSTNSISPNPTAATATLPDQKQIQGKMSCQKQPNGFSTFHVTFVRQGLLYRWTEHSILPISTGVVF